MVKFVHLSRLFLLLLYYNNTPGKKKILFHSSFKLLQWEFLPTFIPLFVVSFCFLDYRENGKL